MYLWVHWTMFFFRVSRALELEGLVHKTKSLFGGMGLEGWVTGEMEERSACEGDGLMDLE